MQVTSDKRVSELVILRLHGRYICKVCCMAHTGPHGLVFNHSKVLGADNFHTSRASLASEIYNVLWQPSEVTLLVVSCSPKYMYLG